MEANIILMKCLLTGGLSGVRIQKMNNGDWYRTWAFKMRENEAANEGYDRNSVVGSLTCTEEFPGCPYCSSKKFSQCMTCGKVSCYHDETNYICPWCGTNIKSVESADSFDVSGGKF